MSTEDVRVGARWVLLFSVALTCAACSGDASSSCSGAILDEERAGSPVVVNEIRAKSADETGDWIELYNVSGSEVDLACWSIVDKSSKHSPYYFAEGLRIPAGGFVALHRDKTGRTGFKWGFGANDQAILRDADGRIADSASWDAGDAQAGTAWGRIPDGTGTFQTVAPPTLLAPNAAP